MIAPKTVTIKAQTTISRWDRTLLSPQDYAGGHRSDPYALFLALAGWQRRAASGRHPALQVQGDEKALENTQTTINYQLPTTNTQETIHNKRQTTNKNDNQQ